jgi:secretion/DNA translocation related CpaE-like protein
MTDVAVRVSDPALARQVFDLVAAAQADVATEIGSRTGLLVTDEIPEATPLPTILVAAADAQAPWRRAAEAGVEQVVVLPEGASLLGRRLQEKRQTPTGTLIRVIGTRGGCGATTLACGLAVTLAGQLRTVLVDGDGAGSGLDVALGIEAVAGLRWGDLADVRGAVAATSILGRLPVVGDLPVLSHGGSYAPSDGGWRPVTESLLSAAATVVADVPRYRAEQLDVRSHAADILVVPHDVVALATARRLIDSGAVGAEPVIALRRIRGPMPAAAAMELLPHRQVVEVPDCAGVRAGTDFGDLAQAVTRRPFAGACRDLADAVLGVGGGR